MSYVKSLKLSPFKTLTLTIGKLPDGGIWQNAFITQEGAETSLSVDCPAHATKAERKGFPPLVKEALRRAHNIEELTSLLKPPSPLVEPILPGVVEAWKLGIRTKESPVNLDYRTVEGWTTAEQEMLAHESSLRGKLLCLLQTQGERHTAAIEAVLNSGLLPEPQLQQWLNQTVERAIRRALGKSGCPEWERWATKWLSGEDRTEAAADAAAVAAEAARTATDTAWAAWAAAVAAAAKTATKAARAAADAAWAARAAADAAWAAGADERKAQYDNLLNLINEL